MIGGCKMTGFFLCAIFCSCFAFSQDQGDSNYAYNQAVQYFAQYKLDDAIVWFENSIEHKHNVTLSYVYKGAAEVISGRIKEARMDLDMAFSLDSTIDAAYFYRGWQYTAMHEYDSAIFFLKKAILLQPQSDEYYDNLSTAYLMKKSYDSARKYENAAIKLSPDNAHYISNLGSIEFKSGDYESAYARQKLALGMSYKVTMKKDPVILINLALCEWKLKKYQEGLLRCEELIREYPEGGRAYMVRGLINYDQGQKSKACSDFLMLSRMKGFEQEGMENAKSHGCPMEGSAQQ